MSKEHLTRMSDEQRQQAKEKRIADQAWAKENIKTEYSDESFWREKASEKGLRLPHWWIPSSEVKYIRRACKKLNVDINEFVENTGFSNVNQLVKANSGWSALGLVGLVVEFSLEVKESLNV